MSNDLVTQETQAEVPALIPADPFHGPRRVAIYLDQSAPELIDQVSKAIQLDECNFPHVGTLHFVCIGLTLYSRQITPAGEEPVRYGRYMALHGNDGRNYVTSAQGVLDFAADLAGRYGNPPWPKGVPVTLLRAKPKPGKIGRCVVMPGHVNVET